MTLRSKILCLISAFFLFSAAAEQSDKTGLELSNSVFSFLKKNSFAPETQSLVTAGENSFPFNNIINIKTIDEEKENLVLVFFQEDVEKNAGIIKSFLNNLKEKDYDFNIKVLFTYGDQPVFENQNIIYGSGVFIDSLKSNLQYTALIYDLNSSEYNIISSSNRTSSPSWLVENSYNLYSSLGIDQNLSKFYLSQISSYSFITNRMLSAFFENDIPAIKLNIKADSEEAETLELLTKTVESFGSEIKRSWEYHFLMISLFGRYYTLSEEAIIKIVLPTICFWVLFIYLFIFINTRLKKHAWSTISRIWYSVPTVFLINIAATAISRIYFKNLITISSDAGKIYGLISLQIITALFFSILFFILTLLYNNSFEARSIDYLLLISCFINQSVFILLDISLCPIFIAICLLTLLALIIKNNTLHVFVFILMIVPLVPYAHNIITRAELTQLRTFVFESRNIIYILPLVLYPSFLIILRILASIRQNSKKFSHVVAAGITFFVSVSAFLIILSTVRTKQINKRQKASPEISYSQEGEKLIEVDAVDEIIFDDIIRTINIKLNTKCILCSVQAAGQKNPVLYTDNDFTTISDNTIRFNIPEYPPERMTFSYGTSREPCTILVTAVIEGSEPGKYRYVNRLLNIGES